MEKQYELGSQATAKYKDAVAPAQETNAAKSITRQWTCEKQLLDGIRQTESKSEPR